MTHPNTPTREPSRKRTLVLAWLEAIEETDPNVISEVLNRCATNNAALRYFLMRARDG